MNHWTTSYGERVSSATVDRRIRFAKMKRLIIQENEHGYNFCTICESNDCKPIDCAHTESVNSCKKNGYVEKAWDTDNIEPVGRLCHQIQDKLNIQSAKIS